MKKNIWIAILLASATFTSFAQHINVVKLDSFLQTLSSHKMAMGSVAISKNGVVNYQKAIGYSSITGDKKVSADINTTYRIGSVTKLFTAVMIFQLIEEGKIKLDQKLNTYFPELPNSEIITIRTMLYHRSGLHDYTIDTDFSEWMDKPKSQEEILRIVKEKGSDFEPEAKADYCNSNYLILGYIIEKLCNMPYAEALKQRITSKLNLQNTYFGKPINLNENESASYKYSNSNWAQEKETDFLMHGGAGSIISTPTDMVSFMDALFSNRLISKLRLDKMKIMVDDYGMGMFPNKYGNQPSFGHNGRIEEFYSALWYFPNEKLSFAFCTNGIIYPRTDIIEGILKICFDEPFAIPFTKKNNLKSENLDQYLGQYSSDQIVVNTTKDGIHLVIETKGKSFEVERIGENYFMNAVSGYFFEFYPAKGELHIKETDNIYYLSKTK